MWVFVDVLVCGCLGVCTHVCGWCVSGWVGVYACVWVVGVGIHIYHLDEVLVHCPAPERGAVELVYSTLCQCLCGVCQYMPMWEWLVSLL